MKKFNVKFCLMLLMICAIILTIGTTAYALTNSKSFYDKISWTWEYSAPATTSYNCLGYATGSMKWEWPWGVDNPTDAQVTNYLKKKGYIDSSKYPEIISYGKSKDVITHFSKVTGTEWCRAKWGSLERFNHNSYDPYYVNSIYGKKINIYSKQ